MGHSTHVKWNSETSSLLSSPYKARLDVLLSRLVRAIRRRLPRLGCHLRLGVGEDGRVSHRLASVKTHRLAMSGIRYSNKT